MQVKNIKFLAKGKRGIVYSGEYRGKKAAIKRKREESKAVGKIENEAKFLKVLNKHKIGPKLISSNGEIIMEFIEGERILDYIEKNDKEKILKVIRKILDKMFLLDRLGINKEEMHHPIKHIIVYRGNPRLIDFERAHYSEKVKNVTQFCQFLRSISELLKKKGIEVDKEEITRLSKEYKNNVNRRNFLNIKKMLPLI